MRVADAVLQSQLGLQLQRALLARVLTLPESLLLRLAGGRRRPVDGQELDAQVQLVLHLAARQGMPGVSDFSTISAAREFVKKRYTLLDPPPIPMRQVLELHIPSGSHRLRARLYEPFGMSKPAPGIVYFHGGGWVVGDLDTHDGQVRVIAQQTRSLALSVEYRLAPEHRFPAAAEDGVAAYRWALAHAPELGMDAERIAVAGDSAGGNLAAVVTHSAAQQGYPAPRAQLLIYPALDLRQGHPSYRKFAEGYLLTRTNLDWYIRHYLGPEGDREDPRASPLLHPDLAGLPPTILVTAGHDPLRDEARAYADRLQSAGAPVRYTCQTGLVHGFLGMTGFIDAAREAVAAMASELHAALAG